MTSELWAAELRKQRRAELAELGELAPPQDEYKWWPQGPEHAYMDDDAWWPLAELLHGVITLIDLEFSCHSQFPPCLLRVLHESHPYCRLHITTFEISSLLDESLDTHERDLVASPCLREV